MGQRIAIRIIEYAGLAGLVGGAFLVLVVGAGAALGAGPPAGLTLAAAVLVAVTFEPARQRLRRLSNRLVYGQRCSPGEAVSRLAVQIGQDREPADLLAGLAEVVRAGTGATAAVVWLRVESTWQPVAASPGPAGEPVAAAAGELPRPPGTALAAPIRHGGQLLGALTVTGPDRGRLTGREQRLVADLAGHAGIVTSTMHLLASRRHRLAVSRARHRELVASRTRLVAAQDAERRRLERDIHDTCQQQAVVLAGQIGLAGTLAQREPAAARAALAAAAAGADRLAAALTRLARAAPIPELVTGGVSAALRTGTGHLPEVEIHDRLRRRYPPDLEAAVYFCCMEAIQNALRHAEASRIEVELADPDGRLTFRARDDGTGFDPDRHREGRGLRNLRERLQPWGGRVVIHSSAAGTEVGAEIPVPADRTGP